MTKLKKEELLAQVDYWGGECRNCAEHHNYSCETGCPHQPRCEQAYQQIKELIQKPEVTEGWTEIKTNEMEQMMMPGNSRRKDRKYFIRSLVEEIHGRK